jgi:hypothetical protein
MPFTKKDWVVYAKPPFGGAEQFFCYLGRYTHRVAISNHRLIRLEEGRVTFQVKGYADNSRKKELTITAVEFIRRFLLHLLPIGYIRIRRHFPITRICPQKRRYGIHRNED